MQKVFNSLGDFIHQDNNHMIYSAYWDKISPLCQTWKYNRDIDLSRVEEIAKIIEISEYVPKIIFLAEIDNQIFCYDGNHRRIAMDKIKYSGKCLIDIMFECDDLTIHNTFGNINKSVQVPSLYLKPKEEKKFIREVVKKIDTKYKLYSSPSSRCRSPNFNIDNLTDELLEISNKLEINNENELFSLLEKLNVEYSKENLCKKHKEYSTKIIEKCKKGGLWLFIDKTINIDHIEKIRGHVYHYVYLIREREFINSKQNIYKIGRTVQKSASRMSQYPKDSEGIAIMQVKNSLSKEKELLRIFTAKFKQRKDIGYEYFEDERENIKKVFLENI